MVKIDDLREGDKILIPATVGKTRFTDGTRVCVLPSTNEIRIFTDSDIKEVVSFHLKVGDRVRWHADGRWQNGTILAVEADEEPTAKAEGRVWAWIKPSDSWVRRTMELKELVRA